MVDETTARRERIQRATCGDEGASSKPEVAFSGGEHPTGTETGKRSYRGCARRHGERLRYRVGWRH